MNSPFVVSIYYSVWPIDFCRNREMKNSFLLNFYAVKGQAGLFWLIEKT